MSATSPAASCCQPNPCDTPQITPVPGPAGNNGLNAFSTTIVSFTVPAVGSTVDITLASSTFAIAGQALYIAGAGYYQVTVAGTRGTITVKNLGVSGNAVPTTVIASPSAVSPAGAQGSPGTLNSLSPTTTKGDLIVDDGTGSGSAHDVRFAAGTNKNVLHADSTQTDGLRYSGIDLTGALTNLSGPLPITLGGSGQITQQAALNALMPTLPVLGDLCYFNNTNWVRFPITVTTGIKQLLRINGAGTSIEYAYQGIIQRLNVNYNTYSNTTNGVALSNTLPVTGNGKLLMTQAITPVSTATKLLVKASVCLLTAAGGAFVAIFNGSTCVAVASTQSATLLQQLEVTYEVAPGSITPITFNVYSGNIGAAGTVYFNGNASAAIWGGAALSTLVVEEYA